MRHARQVLLTLVSLVSSLGCFVARSLAAPEEPRYAVVFDCTLEPTPQGLRVTRFSLLTSPAAVPAGHTPYPQIAALKDKIAQNAPWPSVLLKDFFSAIKNRLTDYEWSDPKLPTPPARRVVMLLVEKSLAPELKVGFPGAPSPTMRQVEEKTLTTDTGIKVIIPALRAANAAEIESTAKQAGDLAWSLARAQGLALGVPADEGTRRAIEKVLRERFLVPLSAGDPPLEYGVRTESNAADSRVTGLIVHPVFVPARIIIELTNWKALETDDLTDGSRLALRQTRLKAERDLRQRLLALAPAGRQLVTNAEIKTWLESEVGREASLAPLRATRDALVLGATIPPTREDYVFSAGGSYSASDGAQGTASARYVYDAASHAEIGTDVSYGAEAREFKGDWSWNYAKGELWKRTWTGDVGWKQRDSALFGGAPQDWRRWRGQTELVLNRSVPSADPHGWARSWRFTVAAVHTDDRFDNAPAALPPTGAGPDTNVSASFAGQFSQAGEDSEITWTTTARLARGLGFGGGDYRYTLADAKLTASLTRGAHPAAWRTQVELRGGTLSGEAPLATEFRAGGDEGWIRGLREGELAGRSFAAASLSTGPEISRLLGEKAPPAYLLAFCDYGRVKTALGPRHASGFGVAVRLDQLPIGDGQPVAATLGYAYSPQSRLDPHGAVFVRIDLPFP